MNEWSRTPPLIGGSIVVRRGNSPLEGLHNSLLHSIVVNNASYDGEVIMTSLPELLKSGEAARLIPVVADTSKENRAASILLATLVGVEEFAALMLRGLGVRVGARTSVRTYTEVTFHKSPPEMKRRPDGLIVLSTGSKSWSAIVEAKIGKAGVEENQIRDYLQLAKLNGIDAVLTFSNEFVALPTHHPTGLPKSATRGVGLFHWSWMHVLTQAGLLLGEETIASVERRYILNEMLRFLAHKSVGVSSFDRMNPEWKELVVKVQSGAPLHRSSPVVENSVASWHQEQRDLCLIMTRRIGSPVRQRLTRAHAQDPVRRLKDDCDHLVRHSLLKFELEIPHAAAPITVVADVEKRSVSCAMRIAAPVDKKRATARVNWLLRQLAHSDPEGIYVKAFWPRRSRPTQASLREIRASPDALLTDGAEGGPNGFEVILVRDLAGKFSGAKTFIEQLEATIPHYYEEVGQHLRAWVPPPPKPREGADVLHRSTMTGGDDIGTPPSAPEFVGEATSFSRSGPPGASDPAPELVQAEDSLVSKREAGVERDAEGGA